MTKDDLSVKVSIGDALDSHGKQINGEFSDYHVALRTDHGAGFRAVVCSATFDAESGDFSRAGDHTGDTHSRNGLDTRGAGRVHRTRRYERKAC